MPRSFYRNIFFISFFTSVLLATSACTRNLYQACRLHPVGCWVRRIKPLRFNGRIQCRVWANGQQYTYDGTCELNQLGLSVLVHDFNTSANESHMAVRYTWAGPHRVIYPHQPSWALRLVRDLHFVLAFPSAVNASSTKGRYEQQGVVRHANGDISRFYFSNASNLPWQVIVIRPDGRHISAIFRWTRQGRVAVIRLHDLADDLQIAIKFLPSAEHPRR